MKPSRMEMLFWGHASSKDPDLITIYFRVTINSQRAELGSTSIKVHRKQWSQEGQRLTARTPEAGQHNQTLSIWKTRVQAIYNDLLRSGEPFTASYVKKLFLQEGKGYSFLHLFDHYLASLVKNPDISAGTRETYTTVRTKVGNWLASTSQSDLLAEHLGKAMLEQYRTYMRNEENRKPATIRKHSNTIKQVLSFGYLNDYIQRNPLQGYRVPSVKPNKPVYLTKEELVTLINYDFGPDKVLGEVRDYFLIQCFTGLAYADIKGLRYDHFSYQEHEQIGMVWLEKDRVKTGNTARQPLHPVVQFILASRYGGKPENIHVRPNQKTNLYLKVIALRLDIAKRITTHTGRRTFANLCLNGGLYSPLFAPGARLLDTVLSKESTITMMGRTSAKGLEAYASPDERRIMQEFKKSA